MNFQSLETKVSIEQRFRLTLFRSFMALIILFGVVSWNWLKCFEMPVS